MRKSGVLMSVTSLPSEYGIGCFDEQAYKFVDDLKAAGQKYWQVLPFGHTSYGDSPYQSFSTFAGNPYFISLKDLIEEGLITEEDCEAAEMVGHEEYVDYERIYNGRYKVLKKAFDNADLDKDEDYKKFIDENKDWVLDYGLFMAIKDKYDGAGFSEWDEEIRLRRPVILQKTKEACKETTKFYCYLQYLFFKQWAKLKAYANENDIEIIGDIPIYVAYDSADVWTNKELFQLDEENLPIKVAGCPPDAFTELGQLWGNPLYNWEVHKQTGYKWWKDRIRACFKMYDVVRIDHFRGFDEFYTIPFGDEDARGGSWEKGPGMDLFHALKAEFGDMKIIAEDLGFLTDSVRELLKQTGYPGMKILMFGFYAGSTNEYVPYNHVANSVVYTGTHDNETTYGWYNSLTGDNKNMVDTYLSCEDGKDVNWKMIKAAMGSVAETCIIPMQDLLGLDNAGRMNTPSTVGDNWKWRMKKDAFDEDLVKKLKNITEVFGR